MVRTSKGSEPRIWVMLISDTDGLPAPRPCLGPALAPFGPAAGAPASPAAGGTGWAAACSAQEHDSQHLIMYVCNLHTKTPMHSACDHYKMCRTGEMS